MFVFSNMLNFDSNLYYKLKKTLRFIRIYGPSRTLSKILGRTRVTFRIIGKKDIKNKDILIVGCGQFGYSTIGHFINKKFGNRFLSCYDSDDSKSHSFYTRYQTTSKATSYENLINSPNAKYIYIASNHFTHTVYAIDAIKKGLNVYIEKPISVNHQQFSQLVNSIKKYKPHIYAGYNRPHSQAIIQLKKYLSAEKNSTFTINCFVSGHFLEKDHWYRNPEEGTRVCGNLGHWIDLSIHLLSIRNVPDSFSVIIAYSDKNEADDNLTISLTSDHGDLITLTLTSRCEPFEGINESINIHYGQVISKIDDFRTMTVWNDDFKKTYHYWPKDVGHKHAVLQPFNASSRSWKEVEESTILMLFIKDMVIHQETHKEFSFSCEWEKLEQLT